MRSRTEGENVQIEALKALQYEGTPLEVASNFKEQGNEMVKLGRWKDAKEYYSRGIAALDASSTTIPSTEEGRTLLELSYCNRGLANLQLQNYRSTISDCAATLRLNPKNVKAHYRSAIALLSLDRVEQAIDTCMHGLSIDKSNKSLMHVMEEATRRKSTLSATEKRRSIEHQAHERERLVLRDALRQRGIRLSTTEKPPDLEDAHLKLEPDPLSPISTLKIPVLFLYPMHAQSDFIKAFDETHSFKSHLEYILPPPWDDSGEYQLNTIDIYTETASGGLSKVGKDLSLLEILQKGHAPVVNEIVTVYIIPRSKASLWIEEMKKRKGK